MSEKRLTMGLGEALQRLLEIEFLRRNGLSKIPEQAREERDMILEALNAQSLNLGFDCDGDGEVDNVNDVSIFERAVASSCCRLAPVRQSSGASRLKMLSGRRGQ